MNSYRIIPALFLSLTFFQVSAQKAKVVSAYNYNKSYERDKDCKELVKGVAAIEESIASPTTNTWAKTWYYGGNLYFNAALTQDEECASKFDNALEKCYTYYLTSMKYNIQDPEAQNLDLTKESDLLKLFGYFNKRDTKYEDPSYFNDIIGNKLPYLANAFVNNGVEAFQAKDFEKAKALSEKSIEANMFLSKVDSLGMYNAALASERLEQYDDAISYYTALTKIKFGGPAIYFYLANLYQIKGDTLNKFKTIQDGLKVYPDNADLIREELAYLLSTGQTEEALTNFDKAIAADNQNPSLYYNRGVIYDEIGDTEKAASDYNKALEVDPDFFDAAYNLGAMYYNSGVEWNKKAGTYGLKEQAKYDEAFKKANDFFKKAMPALEKAHAILPDDLSTIASLIQVYAIVGEEAKYNEMSAKLEKAKAGK